MEILKDPHFWIILMLGLMFLGYGWNTWRPRP